MKALLATFLLGGITLTVSADASFWEKAVELLGEGNLVAAADLSKAALEANPQDADALVIAGTAVLYQRMESRRDDSIFRPEVEVSAPGEPHLTPEGVDAAATYWRQVPSLDPGRSYLWGDLAQLTFRSGDTARALEYATLALTSSIPDPGALRSAAQVFALNLDWNRASQALLKIPGERLGLLYQGLDAWRTGKDGWRIPLKAFIDNPGPQKTGVALASYLIGPAMRDTEAGFLEALKTEDSVGTLAVRQKYVERYPDKFQPRLDLARSLCQYGSFVKALSHYAEIDRKAVAVGADQKQAVLFQQAWAHQGAGHRAEAMRLWAQLADSRDFFLRSAAAWFLGEEALREGKIAEARDAWTPVSTEPARSKYAFWCAQELKKLPSN